MSGSDRTRLAAVGEALARIVRGVIGRGRRTDDTVAATTAPDEPTTVEPEAGSQDLVRGTPHASDPRPLTGHGSVVP